MAHIYDKPQNIPPYIEDGTQLLTKRVMLFPLVPWPLQHSAKYCWNIHYAKNIIREQYVIKIIQWTSAQHCRRLYAVHYLYRVSILSNIRLCNNTQSLHCWWFAHNPILIWNPFHHARNVLISENQISPAFFYCHILCIQVWYMGQCLSIPIQSWIGFVLSTWHISGCNVWPVHFFVTRKSQKIPALYDVSHAFFITLFLC